MKAYISLFLFVNIYTSSCLAHDLNWLANFKQDIADHVERPCPHNEMDCIRRYFSQHGHCKVTHGPTPNPFFIERVTIPLAVPNMTYILNDVKISVSGEKVTEFTINKKTNNLVIAVEVTDLTMVSPVTNMRYHRKAKEPIVLTDKAMITFASITLTAVIPNIKDLKISELEVFSYIEDSNPVYIIGPGGVKSLDEDVVKSFNKLVTSIPETIKETLVFLGPVFTFNFIQYNICDFGYQINAP